MYLGRCLGFAVFTKVVSYEIYINVTVPYINFTVPRRFMVRVQVSSDEAHRRMEPIKISVDETM